MRRTIASLSLALLVAFPAVVPAAAGEPRATQGPAGAAPSASPDVTPMATPMPSDPLPTDPPANVEPATPPPSDTPTATPAPDPTATPASDPTATPAPDPAPTSAATPASDDANGRPDPTGRYIVVLKSRADTSALITRHRQREGTRAIRSFDRAFHGFTARLDREQRQALLSDPNVVAVVPDELIELAGQTTPTGVSRVGAKYSPTAALDGVDQRVDADVAIVDTGIAMHPDLNVVGGYNCASGDRSLWRDKEGHGTHVAGTVGALDNDFGVVGVAPGARLWAVRILNDDGYGLLSWYVCGLDWILAQRDPDDTSRPLIEAVNMSVAKSGSDDHACGTIGKDILHAAICRVVAGGITVVAAAANDSGYASKRVPAAYNEVITVSALADTDGKPGGVGGPRCYSWGSYDKDDTFANFSNFGADVDIMAPGKCIWSTVPSSGYAYSSGTSMAAPAVTGAVALYKATRPTATPREVKEALQYLGNLGWNVATDPDTKHEKLLDVARIGKLGTFAFAAPGSVAQTGEAGGTASIAVNIDRTSTHFERVRFSVVDLPTGWSATFSPSSLIGWTAETTRLAVAVPAGVRRGTYKIRVRATGLGGTHETDVPVLVTNDAPTATGAIASPAPGARVGVAGTVPASVTMRVAWAAATDPSSAIAAYELQRRVDGGAWGDPRSVDAGTLFADIPGLQLAATHEFRLRARDVIGNWSAWAYGPAQQFKSVSDRSASIAYAGSWKRVTWSTATNGVRTSSKQAGATAKLWFTGRSVALVMPRSRVRGKVTIYLDGVKVKTVDTYASTAQARRVVFTKTWAGVGTHKITVRVAGTSGRPAVSLDGYLIGK